MSNEQFYKKLISAIAEYVDTEKIDFLCRCRKKHLIAGFIICCLGEEEGVEVLRRLSQHSPSFIETDFECCCHEGCNCAHKTNLGHLIYPCRAAGIPCRELLLNIVVKP